MRKFLPLAVFTLLLLLVLAYLPAPSRFDPASIQITVPVGQTATEYISPVVRQPAFNAWFVKLQTVGTGQTKLAVRFTESGTECQLSDVECQADWQEVSLEETEVGQLSGFVLTAPTQYYQLHLSLTGETGFAVSAVEIGTQDTRSSSYDPSWLSSLLPTAYARLTDLPVITRAEWQANPAYLLERSETGGGTQSGAAWTTRRQKCEELQTKYPAEFHNDGRKITVNEKGEPLQWPRTYSQKIKKIIIHETASDNGKDLNGDDAYTEADAAATVRAIYYNHAVWRGWGDIGYHYLIDSFGNIYEGRSGGERVISAHVYCANTGTIGISFIGHFADVPPTAAATEAGVRLLGELANMYELDLTDQSEWHGRLTANLVGHSDYGASQDPPPLLHDLLPALRTRAMNYARGHQVSTAEYDYQIISSDSPAHLQPLERRALTVELKNIGQKVWRAGDRFTTSRAERMSNRFGAAIGTDDDLVTRLSRQVSAGGSIVLKIPVAAKMQPGRYRFGVTPNFGGQPGRKFFLVVNVGQSELDYEFIDAQHPPQPFAQDSMATAWVELKNKTNFTWRADGENRAYLGTVRPQGGESLFTKPIANCQLPQPKADPPMAETTDCASVVGLLEHDTAPDEVGRFTIELTAPMRAGRYYLRFAPAVAGLGYLPDYGMNFHITVREPRFSAEITDKSAGRELRFGPGEQKELFVELKNTSQLTWDPEHFELFALQNSGVDFDAAAARLTTEVPERARIKIPVNVIAPVRAGKYRLTLRPRWSNGRTKQATPINFLIEVESPRLTGELIESSEKLELADGATASASFAYENTGNVTWQQADTILQRLPAKASLLVSDQWLSPVQPARLREESVRPGEVGHFDFEIIGAGQSRIAEQFVPIVRGLGRVRGQAAKLEVLGLKKRITRDEQEIPQIEADKSQSQTATTESFGPIVRIRLSFSSDQVGIGGGLFGLYDAADRQIFSGSFVDFKLAKLTEGEYFQVRPEQGTILEIANWAHHPGWTTELNDNRFRGILEIRKFKNELIVINELLLEDYLRGIAEPLPSDPWEKAQLLAVLARSYALYYTESAHRKFPGAPYDGSDNPAEFQRYLGYSYELRGQMPAAAEATRGLVVTYDGAVVKTPYFTSSGGQTRTVAEARWSAADFPFIRSVSDPWSCGLNGSALGTSFSCPEQARGHGVGVSGRGAAGLALEGRTYREILNYFFEGVKVEQAY